MKICIDDGSTNIKLAWTENGELVKRENPPTETGAWKDAVDWVLREACQTVNIGIKGE
ncbi:TPA: hypothetical protein SLT37_004272 [Escherichia coli]|nr:plasmid segregation protein ParM domain-containing protein [Escherichia coli]EFF0830004.1 hypothetical protein [Escherichia coli]EFH9573516.1 hypothetical protein [Escherichia coli]EFJ7484630.1 hypothetical protein [Escherichia coli]EFN8072319.1 hypothetical protein [Escherichia coli]EFT3090380.1 hypothetical protein [Escherichia coli]